MKHWFALLTNGEIISLGKHKDIHKANTAAEKQAHDYGVIWLFDEETASGWRETINGVLKP